MVDISKAEFINYTEIDSTNSEAKRIYEKCGELTILSAERQTAGRGRHNNSWQSDGGKGLFMTVLVKPDLRDITCLSCLSLVTGISCISVLSQYIPCGLKWANDVISVKSMKKISGILAETSFDTKLNYIVIGIGVNLLQRSDDFIGEIKEKATSVYIDSGIRLEIEKIKMDLTVQIVHDLNNFFEKGFSFFREKYKKYCLNMNREMFVGGESIGVAVDVDESGNLIISDKNKNTNEIMIKKINAGIIGLRTEKGYI